MSISRTYRNFILKLLPAVLVGSLVLQGCNTTKDEGIDTTTLILLFLLLNPPASANQTYVDRSNAGLTAWNANLVTNTLTNDRTLGNSSFAHNPANWITVSDSTCNVVGVPTSLSGACPLTGGVIGVCETRFLSTGEIVDSTLLILTSFQTDTSVADAEKQSVFTHEIGHCLGLKHTTDSANVMFANTSGANSPSSSELAAIADAYNPFDGAVSTSNRDNFYNVTGGNALLHFSFPLFHISANIGNRGGLSSEPPGPGKPITGPVTTVRHYMHRDGTCSHETVY